MFPDRLEEKPYTVTALAESGGREYREGFVTTGYSGLRPYNLYLPATYKTSGVNVKVAPGLRVGYVTGTGDAVPSSLENIGIKTEFLSRQDLAQGELQRFDVIVLGVRAYAARPELATNNSRLLDYVKNGGVVVIQYNTVRVRSQLRAVSDQPCRMTRERVVDETSAMQFVDAKSPVLTWPNQITAQDFTGWVEERGHGFLKSWDAHYQAPLETHDAGPGPAKRRAGVCEVREGRLRLSGVCAVPAIAGWRAWRLPAVCQLAEPAAQSCITADGCHSRIKRSQTIDLQQKSRKNPRATAGCRAKVRGATFKSRKGCAAASYGRGGAAPDGVGSAGWGGVLVSAVAVE